MKLRCDFVARTLALSFFLALLGFGYSIITQADAGSRADSVGPRALGSSPLRFLAPAYLPTPGDYDLGDALYGSVISRFVTATGGLRPYNFTSNLGGILGANSTLTVMQAGCVVGAASSTSPANLTFQVSVSGGTETDVNIPPDPVPVTVRNFHIRLFATGAQLFRFANDALNTGVLGQSYLSKVDTIGAKGSVSYSIVAGSVNLNGAQLGTGNSLEDSMGLSFASDGTLYGRPLRTGLVSFKARATDSIKRNAKDRTNSVPDQVFTFNVEDTQITATDSTPLSVSVRGDTSRLNNDTLTFSALMNLSGTPNIGLLNQRFTFNFGGNSYSGYTNQRGIVGTQLGTKLIFPDGTTLSAAVNSANGTVTGTLRHANLSAGLDAVNIVNRGIKRVALSIQICNLVIAADTVEMVTKHLGTRYSLDYNIGRLGRPLGGGFQLFDVRGQDALDIAGVPGDKWSAKFLILPRFGVDDSAGFNSINSIAVRIGSRFLQTFQTSDLKVANNGAFNYSNRTLGASLSRLQINPNAFTGSIVTNPLSTLTTGLPQAVDNTTGLTNFFNLAIDINRVAPNTNFRGEDARALIRSASTHKWVDRRRP